MTTAGFEWGVKCNVAEPRKQARTGALCWVMLTNPGWGGERLMVLMRSRGGRLIETWIATKRLTNLRAAWMPEHIRAHGPGAIWETREQAQAWADDVGAAHSATGDDGVRR